MENEKKIRIGIIFGGKSAEHEISILSAKNVIEALDKSKFELILIGIDKNGAWYLLQSDFFKKKNIFKNRIDLSQEGELLFIIPGDNKRQFIISSSNTCLQKLDVVFPILHGPFGEDGTVQGLLKLMDIPFVGADVIGSAVGMDKDIMKRLLRDSGIPIARFLCYKKTDSYKINFEKIKNELKVPLFIKPANLGSSVGINKVSTKQEFQKAVQDAFRYDTKIIIEEMIVGREIECSVLGNKNPESSLPGEIILKNGFYSYKAKYIDETGAILEIPAKLPENIIHDIQKLAIRTFNALCCEGMARVDFFLKKNGQIVVNEINTIPGFTKISMYPKLWQISGITNRQLISRLIEIALNRYSENKKIETSLTWCE